MCVCVCYKEVDNTAAEVYKYCESQNNAVEKLSTLVGDLPKLNQTLTTLILQLGKNKK